MSSPRADVSLAADRPGACQVAVIWIDWYPYHVARFRGIAENPQLRGHVAGIELVGGVGVHVGLKFREPLPPELPIWTLLPSGNWTETNQLRLCATLWQALSELDPETVLVPGYYTLPGLTAALWARLHARTSVLMSESAEEDHPRAGLRERVKSLLLRGLFDWAVTGGTAHERYLTKLGFPPDRIARFYDVVDNGAIRRATESLRAQPGSTPTLDRERSPFFLFVGRLATEKNVSALVSAWVSYRAAGGSWSLVLAGDGPERQSLEQQLAGSGFAQDATITGLRTSSELMPLYAAAGCFVLPSLREPWGLVVNEAMAAALPVLVSTRCGCAVDLVRDGENGFTFDPSPSSADTQPSKTLLGRMRQITSLSGSERRRMGACSASRIDLFSPRAFGEEIASIASTRT